MAPDTSLQSFVNASASSLSLPVIPTTSETIREAVLEEEYVDPDAKLILSDFTQITEYFPMDLYRSMFFVNTLDYEYNRALESFDSLARTLYNTSLPEETVKKIKLDMSRNINLMMANRNETLAEATRLYETVDQAFNTLDTSITVSEENLLNPPSETYFLPNPTEEEEELIPSDSSSEASDAEDEDDAASIKTDDLKPSHLHDFEMKSLRRRMKKSIQWFPSPVCIKKELQTNGRWPVRFVDKEARHRRKMAKLQRKRRREAQRVKREQALSARKAARLRLQKEKEREEMETQKRRRRKNQAGVQYGMPVAANEPTYCYCGDVSYGEMIACENDACRKEWFHLDCAGLEAAPKGKWYCRDCKPGADGLASRKRKRA